MAVFDYMMAKGLVFSRFVLQMPQNGNHPPQLRFQPQLKHIEGS